MSNSSTDIMDLTKVSVTFPKPPEPLIERENIIQALHEMLAADTEVLFIEGPEGIGKSTLLSLFALNQPNSTFSLFVSGSSRYSYDSSILLADLSEQIGWILKKEKFRTDSDEEPAKLLYSRIIELQRQAKQERKIYYFAIDGLHSIPLEGAHELSVILNALPFGVSNFRFLFSGSPTLLGEKLGKLKGVSPFRMIGFSMEDTERFFGDLLPEKHYVASIHQISRMMPGSMASVRRLLRGGKPCADLFNDLSINPPDWLQLEWDAVNQSSPSTKAALATLAFYRSKITAENLSDLCGGDKDVLIEDLSRFTFIQFDHNGLIDFVCEAFRRIAIQQLGKLKKQTMESITKHLMQSPRSEEALTNLPFILHQSGQHSDLIQYLSPENIEHIIHISDSWVPLHEKVELAVTSALKLEEDSDLLRFSIQNSALTTLESADPWRSEIEAYVALEDYSAISALAQNMPTKEDRLHLFAVIARSRKEKGLSPDTTVNEQIKNLFELIDRKFIGQRGIDIAADLVYTHPELAIELVQSCANAKGFAPTTDIVFASMSLNALFEKSEGMQSAHLDLRARIKDPAIQKYIDTASLHFGSYSAEAVIAEVSGWEKASDRITALEGWTTVNRSSQGAKQVILYALETILKTTTYTANARVYYHLALPLPSIADDEFTRSIVVKLDGLKGPIEQAGPTTEYVKLQGVLAEVEWKYNRIAAYYRTQDIFFYIEKMTDFSTKMASFAVLVAALKRFDLMGELIQQGPILESAIEGLHATAEQILNRTANHFDAILPAIGILATAEPDLAFNIIDKVNTIRRQDKALIEFIRAISRNEVTRNSLALMDRARQKINYRSAKSLATVSLIEIVFAKKASWDAFADEIPKYANLVLGIDDAATRCRMNCILACIGVAYTANNREEEIAVLKMRLHEDWNSITSGWTKVDAGFRATALLASGYPDLARDLLNKTEAIRGEIILDSRDSATCFLACVRLSVRAFAGLIKNKSFEDRDIESLKALILRIPCKMNQIVAWSELAMRFFMSGEVVRGCHVVDAEIKPALDRYFTKDGESRFAATANAATALYCAHPISALQLIKGLPARYSDQALGAICDYLIAKKNSFEDYDAKAKAREITTYENFLDVCEILSLFDSDFSLYWTIQQLINGIGKKRFKRQFSAVQKADFKDRIAKICSSCLPKSRFIKHEGYKILIEALLLQLFGENTGWDGLLIRARALPNYADATLVLMGIAECMPLKEKPSIMKIFQEAKERTADIPFFEDRIHHYEALAEAAVPIDKGFGKDCIKQAWTEAMPLPSIELPRVRRRLIDFAHRVDPDFAAVLASETAEDPGREWARLEAKQQLDLIKIKEDLASGDPTSLDASRNAKNFVSVSQMMLAGLNSGRISSMHVSKIRPFIEKSSRLPIDEAYSVLSWAIENVVQKAQSINTSASTYRELFEASRLSAELTFRVAARMRAVADSGIFEARSSDSDSGLIKPGDRDLALEKIAGWARNAVDFIKISDPYFGPDELEIIKIIRAVNATIPIRILTSRSHQNSVSVSQPWDETYQACWRISVSDADPGPVTIIVVGQGKTGSHPIHDRWLLSRNSALRIGTSLNSMGETKASEISEINPHEIDALIMQFDSFALFDVPADRLKRMSFEL